MRSAEKLSDLSLLLDVYQQSGQDRSAYEIWQALEAENIESRPAWKPMHLQPAFADCKMYGGKVCDAIFDQGLCLPSGTNLSKEQQDRVIAEIQSCAN